MWQLSLLYAYLLLLINSTVLYKLMPTFCLKMLPFQPFGPDIKKEDSIGPEVYSDPIHKNQIWH